MAMTMPEHTHTHESATTCDGLDGVECGNSHHEKYSHSHEGGHEFHDHRTDGMRLIKLEEVVEPEPKKTSTDGLFNA